MTEKDGDRASTSGGERQIELDHPAREYVVFPQVRTASKCEEYFVFGTKEKGNRLHGSGNESTCEGVGR